mmetsp:Transcript_44824/g.70194  ORF Transcript_44824/g.70194 Transcript_44824/m.70194 type:complete len:114 (-) Transcript_44824:767-1108(-)
MKRRDYDRDGFGAPSGRPAGAASYRNYNQPYQTWNPRYGSAARRPVSPEVWQRRGLVLFMFSVPVLFGISLIGGVTDQIWEQQNKGKQISRVVADKEKRSGRDNSHIVDKGSW